MANGIRKTRGIASHHMLIGVALVALLIGVLWWGSRDEAPERLSSVPEQAFVSEPPAAPEPPPADTTPAATTSASTTVPATDQNEASVPAGTQGETSPARAYIRFTGEPPAELTRDHRYTAEGLRKLAAVLEAKGKQAAAERLNTAAKSLEEDPKSLRHADLVRNAFREAAEAMESMGGSGSERTAGLRSAAEAIRPAEPLRDQKAEVDRFFSAAAKFLSSESSQAPVARGASKPPASAPM